MLGGLHADGLITSTIRCLQSLQMAKKCRVMLMEYSPQLANYAVYWLWFKTALGSLALEACNCIASSFSPSSETSLICSKLIETAKPCLSKRDRFLESTVKVSGQTIFFLSGATDCCYDQYVKCF